jgi:hypothetical protein
MPCGIYIVTLHTFFAFIDIGKYEALNTECNKDNNKTPKMI